jgi:alcohol dehydrogenase
MVTHRFRLEQMEEAYDIFARAAQTGALKVVLGGPTHDEVSVAGRRDGGPGSES